MQRRSLFTSPVVRVSVNNHVCFVQVRRPHYWRFWSVQEREQNRAVLASMELGEGLAANMQREADVRAMLRHYLEGTALSRADVLCCAVAAWPFMVDHPSLAAAVAATQQGQQQLRQGQQPARVAGAAGSTPSSSSGPFLSIGMF